MLRLFHEDNTEVRVGDEVTTFRGEKAVVISWTPPHKPNASGYCETNLGRHYVGVYSLFWKE